MSNLLIFDPADNLLAVLSNEAEDACAFWDAPYKETLNQGSTFEFMADGSHEDSKYIIAENQVAFMDKDGAFRLFVIKEPERIDGEYGPEIHAICEPSMLELNDEIITDVRPYNTTLQDALSRALNGVRWQVGQTSENFGLNSTNFYYISVTEAIVNIVNTWGGEIRDRVEIQGNRIVGRYIDILTMRGTNTGKRWEMDKDILSIRHQVQSYPKTALYGRGASLELEDEEGNATGGYSRKISFADVEWKKANGHPVDKPKGQEWVGDSDAILIYGRPNKDGTLRHRFGIFESEQEDPELLLLETWNALQEQKHPLDNYEMDVFLMEEITGYEHEKVRLGDITVAIDRSFAKPIEAEERVISFEYDVADPDNSGKVELGQFINLYDAELDNRVNKLERKLNDRAGIWDNATKVIDAANGKNKNYYSPIEPTGEFIEGDLWFKVIDGEYSQTYRWNGEQWQLIMDLDVNIAKEQAAEATQRAEDAVNQANEATSNAQQAITDAQSAFDTAQDALTTSDAAKQISDLASEVADEAKQSAINANTKAQDAVNQANIAKQNAQNAVNKANALETDVVSVISDLGDLQQSVDDDVTALNNRADDLLSRVNDNAANLLAAGGRITSVEQEVDTVSGKLATTITTLSDLDGVVSEQQTAITALDEKIELRATKTSVDTLTGRVSSAEGSITTLAGQVSLKANASDVYTKSQVNTELGKKIDTTVYNNKMSQLDVSINGISANVSSIQSTVSDVDSRLTTAQSQITSQAGQINLKANKSDVYTKTESDGKVTTAVNNAKAEIKVTTDGISQSVSSLTATVDGIEIGTRNLIRNSDRSSDYDQWVFWGGASKWINGNYSQRGIVATNHSSAGANNPNGISSNNFEAKADEEFAISFEAYFEANLYQCSNRIEWYNSSNSRVGTSVLSEGNGVVNKVVKAPSGSAYGKFVQNAIWNGSTNGYVSKVSWLKVEKGNKHTDWSPAIEDIEGAISDVQSYATSINQKTDSIQSSVSSLSTTVNSQGSRLTSAESTISQHTTAINLKAEATNVYTKAQTDSALNNKVNTSTYNTKMGQLDVSVNNITSRVSSTESSISSINSNIASLDIKADGIISSVTQVQTNLDNLEIGGRNLITGASSEYRTLSRNGWGDYPDPNTNSASVEVIPGKTYSARIYLKASTQRVALRIRAFTSSIGAISGNYNDFAANWIEPNSEGYSYVTFTVPTNRDRVLVMSVRFDSSSTPTNTVQFKELKLETGNRITDWTPAPEDMATVTQFSTLEQTVNGFTTRVGAAEGNISSLQQTSSSFASRITDAEGDISSISQTLSGVQTTVANKADKSTVTQLAGVVDSKITKTQADGWYATQSQLTQTANSLTTTITNVQSNLNNLQIGGRNLSLYTSNQFRIANFSGWDDYFLNLADQWNKNEKLIGRIYLKPENYEVSIMIRIRYQDGTYSQYRGNIIKPGEEGYSVVSLTIPDRDDISYIQPSIRHSSGSTPTNRVSYKELKVEKGDKSTDWTPAPEDVDTAISDLQDLQEYSESQISQLSDAINLRVKTADLMTQINLNPQGILIQGKNLILDGNTTVNGTFKVNNANINSVDAGKITTGILDASKVSINNLNVNKLVGNIATFVQTNFNNVSSQVSITGSGLETYSGGQMTSRLTGNGHDFYRDNVRIGRIGATHLVNNPSYKGLSFNMTNGCSYMAWAHDDNDDGVFTNRMTWYKDDTLGTKGFTLSDSVRITGGATINNGLTVSGGLDLGSGVKVTPFNNAFRISTQDDTFIRQFNDGQFDVVADGASYFSIYKNGGATRVLTQELQVMDNKSWGRDPYQGTRCAIKTPGIVAANLFRAWEGIGFENGTSINGSGSVTYPTDNLKTNGSWITGGSDSAVLDFRSNIAVQTWYGFSVGPTISGFNTPQGRSAFVVNARDGNIFVRKDGIFSGWVTANNFVNNSKEELKTDIKPMADGALDMIRTLDLYEFRYKEDIRLNRSKKVYGLVIGDSYRTPDELLDYDKQGVDQYSFNTVNTKAIQELALMFDSHTDDINYLKMQNQYLLQKIKQLEEKPAS